MKLWAKYLTIGWSIVCVAIVIVSYQLMKSHFVEEDYEISTVLKVPEKIPSTDKESHNIEMIGEFLFSGKDVFHTVSITKKEFVEKIKKAKGITIETKTKVKDNSIYLILPLYAFAIWMIPILVFSLVGLLFLTKKEVK
jgi:hypothetical protein